MRTPIRLIPLLLSALLATTALAAETATGDMEILRQKIKADKKLVVALNMSLTDTEAAAFWAVYDEHQLGLQAINERLGKTILAYADAYNAGPVTDETAASLLAESLDIEKAELELKQSSVAKLEKAIPAAKVARYIQIENKIRALIRYDLAEGIPLVE